MRSELSGIEALLRHQLHQKSKDELVETGVDVYKLAGRNISGLGDLQEELAMKEESYRKHHAAGARARAKSYQPKRDKVSAIYDTLKSANGGKNPKLKELIKEVEKIYSDEELSSYTIQGWHKKLNKGEIL